MPPKAKKPVTGTAIKKSSAKSQSGTTTPKKGKKTTPARSLPDMMNYQQLQELLRSVKHNLPMLPKTALSFVHSTYFKPALQHFAKNREVETGLILGYLARRSMSPHPFIWRRDFMLNQTGKIGGFPSWLIPQHIPSTICQHCSQPMHFLLQFSAPISSPDEADHNNDVNSASFQKQAQLSEQSTHRMLYLFACTDPQCVIQHNSLKVLRAQLPLDNPFYGSEPAQYIPTASPQSHDFRYPFETLITPQQQPQQPHQQPAPADPPTPLCIMCGGKAILPCGEYGPDDSTPIYCSPIHQQYNTAIFHINATTPLTLTTPLDQPPTPSTFAQTAQGQSLLESTVIFPRFGLRTDFEVMDDEALGYFKDTFDIQIEEYATNAAAITHILKQGEAMHELGESKLETCQDPASPDDAATTTTTPQQDAPQDGPEPELSQDTKEGLLQEQTLVEQYLSQITDPQLRSQIDSYLKEEQGKSLAEKFQDLQTFSPSLDEADNYSITEQDPTFLSFQTRIELTLPPLQDDGLDIEPETDPTLQQPQVQQYLDPNPFSAHNITKSQRFSQQILRYHPYIYRTTHLAAEPLWTHKLNRLQLNDCAIANLPDPNSPPPTQSAGLTEDDVVLTPSPHDFRKCPNCGGRRLLEAQLMPFLCTFLLSTIESQQKLIEQQVTDHDVAQIIAKTPSAQNLAQFDFSTIAIFTCENSCASNGAASTGQYGYIEEFAYLQPAL